MGLCGFCLFRLAASAARVLSPEIHANGSVTFRLAAPSAARVRLNLEGQPNRTLTQDLHGLWTVTIDPLEPDYYGYSFTVDGVPALDVNNPDLRPNLLSPSNTLHVPGPPSLPWELAAVPHGTVHHHLYHSVLCGDDRDYYVYTPPGYETAGPDRLYPTLYLLHGFSDDASAWVAVGRVNVLLDNLIAQKKAKPMVVVMPLGYGTLDIVAKAKAGNGDMRSGGPALMATNGNRFQSALLQEILPQAEDQYRLSPQPADRAIAGNSMGGGEALRAGLVHPDLFAWVASFSAGGLSDDLPAEFAGMHASQARRVKLLWMACGPEDFRYPVTQALRAYFTSKGMPHTDSSTPGPHIWPVWRRNFADLAPLLFR